ncbi:MAG TPA: hypothetical protein VFR97_07510 [Capillimicrobium sp.]|nr:hypothetical protein [Capillimicrobium sp.]
MRSFLTAVLVLAAVAPTAGAVTVPAGTAPCPPKKHDKRVTVLSRTAKSVIFERRGRTIACWRPAKRAWALGRGAAVSAVVGEQLAYGAGDEVRLLQLPTGEATTVDHAVDTGSAVSGAKVTSVVLRGDGAIAWIGEATSGGAVVRQVRQVGGLLGTGSGIDPTSLRLKGDRVAWTQSGVERSAPLTLPAPNEPAETAAAR